MSRNLPGREGQGLVEYALMLMMVSMVVIFVLTLIGPAVGNVFSQVRSGLTIGGGSAPDVIVLTRANYDADDERAHIDATSDGTTDPEVVLTASPGGVMERHPEHNHYHLVFDLAGCPCLVTVASNRGGSVSVTLGS